jgi:hypothetical protein
VRSFRLESTLFSEPSHFVKDSSFGAQNRYVFSSATIWRQNFLDLETGSISAALMIWDMGIMRTAEYSCDRGLVGGLLKGGIGLVRWVGVPARSCKK